MTTNSFMPTLYGIYNKNKSKIREGKTKTNLHRFPYRYRLAKGFKGISVEKGLEKSLDGYDVGMKILLATSALEEIREAAKSLKIPEIFGSQGRAFVSEPINKSLRKNKKLAKFVIEHADGDKQRKQLLDFFGERDNDIIVIAFALRHAFAHGDFTPGGSGITKKTRDDFLAIADSVIAYSDLLFDKCVRQVLANR
jgi:hypothetical protein